MSVRYPTLCEERTGHACSPEKMRMKKKAADDIQMEKQKAFREAKGELSGIALDIASQILDREVSENDHAAMIEDFIKNVGEA